MLESQKKIIFALGIKNGQTFTELLKNANTNRDSLWKGLNELKKLSIKKKGNLYYLTETKNRAIRAFKESNLMDINLKDAMKDLEEYDLPFELGAVLLRTAMYNLSHLTLEQHSAQLSDIEKVEIEKLIEFCNKVIEGVFEVLHKKDPEQTIKLSLALGKTMGPATPPIPKTPNRKEKWRVDKLMKDIFPYHNLR